MNIQNNIAKEIFENRYSERMNFDGYMNFLREGVEILNRNNEAVKGYHDLNDLKAIKIALQYRIAVLRQHRSKQLELAGFPG